MSGTARPEPSTTSFVRGPTNARECDRPGVNLAPRYLPLSGS
jgi:hypothetical protein